MRALIGVVAGNAVGTRAGEQVGVDFKKGGQVISSSDEIRDLVAAGFSHSGQRLRRGSELPVGTLETSVTESGRRPAVQDRRCDS